MWQPQSGKVSSSNFVESNYLSAVLWAAVVTSHFLWWPMWQNFLPRPKSSTIYAIISIVPISRGWNILVFYSPNISFSSSFVVFICKKSRTLISQRKSHTVQQGLNLPFFQTSSVQIKTCQTAAKAFLCALSFSSFPYGEQTVCVSSEN